MQGTLQCGTLVVLVTLDLSYGYWTVVTGQFIFCYMCVLGRFLAFLAVLVGSF